MSECVRTDARHTCEVVEAVVLEDLVQDAQKLPHLGRDGLTGEAKRQRQDLLVELCRGHERTEYRICTHIHNTWCIMSARVKEV